jgi:hypothetical protein
MARPTYAPRGPLKAPDHPLSAPDPMGAAPSDDTIHGRQRCTAKSKQKGVRCGRTAIPGGMVCRYHGGLAPQVQQKAMERLLALQHPAIDTLTELMAQTTFPSTRYAAARDVLDRTLGKPAESVAVEHSGAIEVSWKGD